MLNEILAFLDPICLPSHNYCIGGKLALDLEFHFNQYCRMLQMGGSFDYYRAR